MRIASCAKDDRLLSALIDRAVADQPNISVHQVAIGFENLFEMGRASLLFSLPDETDVGPQRNAGSLQRIQGSELGKDRRFVVARGARKAAGLTLKIVDVRLEGRNCPLGRRDGLSIVMRIEDDGVLSAGRHDLAEDNGRSTD